MDQVNDEFYKQFKEDGILIDQCLNEMIGNKIDRSVKLDNINWIT